MLTPPVTVPSPLISSPLASIHSDHPDLDTPDELALRSLLLGVAHYTLGHYDVAYAFLDNALRSQGEVGEVSKWITATARYQHAVLVLLKTEKETADVLPAGGVSSLNDKWEVALAHAEKRLEEALVLAKDPDVDVSEILVIKIGMLKDEIALKREMLEAADDF
jgi:NTP pyrophosphatase (non-canonical NTP hydrolase)